MYEKRQKIEFSDLKNLLFSGIFLSGIEGYPPPPLNGKSSCPKTLSGNGGYPPPLNGKNPLSSFWQLPLGFPYLSDLHDLIAFDLSIKKQDDNFFKTYIQSFWSLRSSLCHNVYLFSTWVKKDFHFFSEHFLFLTNFFSRELTCWSCWRVLLQCFHCILQTLLTSLHFRTSCYPREMPSFPGKLVMCLVSTTFYKRREIFSVPEKNSCTLSQVWKVAPTIWFP